MMKRSTHTRTERSRGFTMVELMIATGVFSVVLILVTTGILQFSRVYYKGVTEANTQNTARTVMDVISQGIQFGGGAVVGTPTSAITAGNSYNFCIGNTRYSYRPGYKLVDGTPGTDETNHALVSQTVSGCSASSPADMTLATLPGRELLATNMRVADLDVVQDSGNLYKIHIRVVFGEDDLLNNATGPNAACKGSSGGQFCAVSDLSTTVIKRVE